MEKVPAGQRYQSSSISAVGNSDRRLGARNVIKLIVNTNRYAVLPRCDLLQQKIVILARRVAQSSRREDQRPISRIQTVLRARDKAHRSAGLKSHTHPGAYGFRRELSDRRWRIIHDEAIGFARGRKSFAGGI